MPIADVRRYAALVRAGAGNEGERFALLEAHEQRVRAHIAELQESLTIINGKVDVYRRHLAEGVAAGLWVPTAVTGQLSTRPNDRYRINFQPLGQACLLALAW
jgi:hypothetical protein